MAARYFLPEQASYSIPRIEPGQNLAVVVVLALCGRSQLGQAMISLCRLSDRLSTSAIMRDCLALAICSAQIMVLRTLKSCWVI